MPSKLVRNEQVKLLASGVNNVGIAVIVGGVLGPIITRTYGSSAGGNVRWLAFLMVGYFITGVVIMGFGRHILRELEE